MEEDLRQPPISPGFLIGLAGAIAGAMLLLSCRILPTHLDQAVYQIVLLAAAAAILIEGARRQRVILFDSYVLLVAGGFVVTLVISFFSSEIHKYELSSVTLNRLLWLVVLWASFLIAVHNPRLWAVLVLSAALGLLLMGWRYANTDEQQRLVMSILGGLLACLFTGVGRRPTPEASKVTALKMLAVMAGGAFVVVMLWLTAEKVRLNIDEIDLVRNGRQTEKAVWTVTKQCIREHPLLGYGGGSIQRKFLQYRPADATMQGVGSRLEVPTSTFAVLAAENGVIGLGAALLLLSMPLIGLRSIPVFTARIGISYLYGIFLIHEILGGGWLLTNAGAMVFFTLAGAGIARPGTGFGKDERNPPGSFFVMGLIAVGGIFLLQQIYCWRTVQVEKSAKDIRRMVAEKKITEAANQVDYCLVFLDSRRNDLISILIGGFHGAGMIQQALQNSVLLLQRDPDYPSVENNIATFYMLLRRPQEALPYMQATVEEHPTTENISKLAYIYAITGQKDQAEKYFMDALNLYPREVDILLARSPTMTDVPAEEANLEEAAKFSASAFAPGTPNRDWAVQRYLSETQRLKSGLGRMGK